MNPSNTEYVIDSDSSSSSEEDSKFSFWGAGGGSSGSLSKYMVKREKESRKEMQKELAAKREAEIAKEKAELAKADSVKAELLKAELVKAELAKAELAKADSAKAELSRIGASQSSAGSQTLSAIGPSLSAQALSQSSSPERTGSRDRSSRDRIDSREQIYEAPRYSVENTAAIMAAYVAQAMSQGGAFSKGLYREEFDAEPELLDSTPASKVLRRIGAYRNWTEDEIQTDLNALEFHRLRTVKDLRELSYDSWKEIKELVPLVRELLVREISKGRNISLPRTEGNYLPKTASSFSMADTPTEAKNIKAPTSTPMDSPDMGQLRKTFQVRQW